MPAATQPSSNDRQRTLPVRLAAIAVIVAVLGLLSRNAFLDDALIYARYVANALHGLGLVFNPGEHINALTSPLYSYVVLAGAKLLGGHVLGVSATISALALFAACVIAETLVPFAGLLLAATGYFYSLVGMESSLFLCLILVPILLLDRDRIDWVPTAAALLVLTRFEGAALTVPLAVELHRQRRWPSSKAYIPVVLIAAAYLLLNHHWYGAFLPASAGAKLGQGRSGLWGPWPTAFFRTAYQLKPEFQSTLYVVLAVVVLAVPGAWKLRRTPLLRLSLPFLAILLAFYLLFNLPGYKWYYAPFICFGILYACAAIPNQRGWRAVAVLVVLLSAATAMRRYRAAELAAAAEQTQGYPAIAHWLAANAPANARVEAGEIGTLGWYCQRCYILDILGLTYPKNAEHIAHHDTRSWLAQDRPDFVVVHQQPWVFEDVVKADPGYERVPVSFGPIVYLLQRRP